MNSFTHKLLLITASSMLTGLHSHCMENVISPSLEVSNNDTITPDTLPKELWRNIVFLALENELSSFRCFTTLQGHKAEIYSVVYSPNGKTVITGSNDNTARLWDVATGQQLHLLQGHTDLVSSVAYSPNGKTVITGSRDSTARLWDVETGKELHQLQGHTHTISSVAFSPDGKTVITGSWDGSARLWRQFAWNKETKELFIPYYPLLRGRSY